MHGSRATSSLLTLLVVLGAATGRAGPADVLSAEARCGPAGACTFTATVQHADAGWSHYVDRWEVVGPDGEVIEKRRLHHPHVEEQPFTRSLPGVRVPDDVTEVTIRAHDSVHGLGGAEVRVPLER